VLLGQRSMPTSRRLPPLPLRTSTTLREGSRSLSVSASASLMRRPARQSTTITPRSLISLASVAGRAATTSAIQKCHGFHESSLGRRLTPPSPRRGGLLARWPGGHFRVAEIAPKPEGGVITRHRGAYGLALDGNYCNRPCARDASTKLWRGAAPSPYRQHLVIGAHPRIDSHVRG
jgi:hypothetical protein